MTPAETLNLCRLARGMCPQQAFDEYTPDAWHLLLSDLDAAEALAALTSLAQKQPFVSPAEIRGEAKARRKANALAVEHQPGVPLPDVPHDMDPDDTKAYADWLRATRAAAARGVPAPSQQLVSPAPVPSWWRRALSAPRKEA